MPVASPPIGQKIWKLQCSTHFSANGVRWNACCISNEVNHTSYLCDCWTTSSVKCSFFGIWRLLLTIVLFDFRAFIAFFTFLSFFAIISAGWITYCHQLCWRLPYVSHSIVVLSFFEPSFAIESDFLKFFCCVNLISASNSDLITWYFCRPCCINISGNLHSTSSCSMLL